MRRRALTLCTVLLVATAGCTGFFAGGDGPPPREPYGVSATPTHTATTTPTATTTRTPTGASPAFRAVLANHSGALQAVGNYTVHQDYAASLDGRRGRSNQSLTVFVDPDAGRYALGAPTDSSASVSVYSFQNGTATFRRTERNGSVTYLNVTGDVGPNRATPRRVARTLTDLANGTWAEIPFERNGTVTVDGAELTRYTATDNGQFRGDRYYLSNVTAFSATALVDDRGIVRRITYRIRGRTGTGETYVESVTVAVRDVNGTDVPWPEALANASDPG